MTSSNTQTLNKIGFYIWSLILFSAIAMPSGNLMGAPYRLLLLVTVLALITPALIASIRQWWNSVFILWLSVVLLFFVLQAINGLQAYPALDVIIDLKLWLTLTVFVFLTWWFLRPKNLVTDCNATVMFKALLAGAVVFMLWKLGLYLLSIISPQSFPLIAQKWFAYTQYQPVTWPISIGGLRINYINHDFIVLVIAAVLGFYRTQFSTRFTVFLWLLVIVTEFIAYSRVMLALTLIALLWRFWQILQNTPYKKQVILTVITITALAILINYAAIAAIIQQRFIAYNLSDLIRQQTTESLLNWSQLAPWIGHGMGSHVYGFVRDTSLAISYEPQLITLITRFGWLVPLLVCLMAIFFYNRFLQASQKKAPFFLQKHITLSLILVVWLSLSLTNQYLLGSTSAVLLVLFWLLFPEQKNFKIS